MQKQVLHWIEKSDVDLGKLELSSEGRLQGTVPNLNKSQKCSLVVKFKLLCCAFQQDEAPVGMM